IDRSAPAMKAGLADVTTTPLTPGSAIAASAAATYSLMLSSDRTFMDRPGMSQISVTMPSASFSTRMLVMDCYSTETRLHAVDDGGGAHAGTDAQRGKAGGHVAALHLVEQGAQDHGAGRAQRVSHGDGAAVHIDLVVGNVEQLHEQHDDRRKRLVQLIQVD